MGTTSASAQAPPMAFSDRLVGPPVLGAVLAFLAIAPVAAGQGGYFPVAWGWMGLAYAWVGAIALVLRTEIRISRAEYVMVAGAGLVLLWTLATLFWTSSATATMLAAEHALAYFAFVAALVVVCERGSALGLLVGTWAAITLVSLYSLATHLGPAVFGVYRDPLQPGRLFQPLGYWNALGIFCVMGMLLALGIADRRGNIALRAIAAASIAPLAATTYFTFSRGSWLALGLGFVFVVALNPQRLRYLATALVVASAPALAVAYAASHSALTTGTATLPQIAHAGSRAALAICAAAVVSAALVVALALAQSRISLPRVARQVFAGVLVAAVAVCCVVGVVRYGSPITRGQALYDELTAPAPAVTVATSLNNRLLSVSLNDRQYLWHGALKEFHAYPVGGGGAGTYADYWLAHRSAPDFVVNAHSLYLEVLGEEGIVGLAVLLVFLAPALVVAVRFRPTPEVSIASGAYLAFVAHAGVDWDWQVSATALVGFAVAVAALVAARSGGIRPISRGSRWTAVVAFAAVAIFAVLGLVSNRALSEGAAALARGDTAAALSHASTAHAFAPWADAPQILAGQAYRKANQRQAERASFTHATETEPGDWIAWQWRMRATTGSAHREAVARLRALDPRYDFVEGRP